MELGRFSTHRAVHACGEVSLESQPKMFNASAKGL